MIIYTFTIVGYLNDEVTWFISLKDTITALKDHLRATGVSNRARSYIKDMDKYIEENEGKSLEKCYHIGYVEDMENYNPAIYIKWMFINE
jgi:hypothetical protein